MNFLGRIKGFTISMSDWVSDGMPNRDPEETLELFTTHCQPCPEFLTKDQAVGAEAIALDFLSEDSGFCSNCGCVVSSDPTAIFNKVNKPNQECPLKKWVKAVE